MYTIARYDSRARSCLVYTQNLLVSLSVQRTPETILRRQHNHRIAERETDKNIHVVIWPIEMKNERKRETEQKETKSQTNERTTEKQNINKKNYK